MAGTEIHDEVERVITSEPVVLFMKGTPSFIACGNSGRALEALRALNAPITTVDVLPDPRIRQELSAISGWPTIPQVFIGGELVGGADIVEELHESGELEQRLDQRLGDGWRGSAPEQVIDVVEGPTPFRVVP